MKLKLSILTSILLLSLSGTALAAPVKPGQHVIDTFAAVNQFKAEEPSADQVKQAKNMLFALLDKDYLQQELLSNLTVELTKEQKDLFFSTISDQFTIGTLKNIAKNEAEKNKRNKPTFTETIDDKTATVVYTLDTKRGKRDLTCLFALVGDKYLLRDITFGKHSMVALLKKQLKKGFKRNTFDEVIQKIKKHGFEIPQEVPEETPAT